MAELRIPIIVENKGKKAFKEVDNSITGLTKNFKKLAGAAGIGLSTAAVINFGKNAVKAFAENEKSANRLAGVVKNLGLALETPIIEANLDRISAKFGYQGEVLRESYQKLITATGSLEKSQDLLNLSLDVSAGSTFDLLTVNQDLANLYVGNTRGLKKYNLGLSQAQLQTIKYEDAVALLAATFKGAAQQELGTFSAQMRVLGEAAGNAQEIIGGGLIDALMILTGDTDMDGLARSMQDFAESTSAALKDWAKLQKTINDSILGQVLKKTAGDLLLGRNYGEIFGLTPYKGSSFNPDTPNVGRARRFFAGGQDSVEEAKRNKARALAEAEALKAARARAALEKKAAMDAKKKAALESAARKLDLQRINISAALKGKISETDKLSLQLQLALLNENDTEAKKLSDQLDAAIKRQKELEALLLATPKAPNPFSEWKVPKLDFGGNVLGSAVPNYVPPSYVTPETFTSGGAMGPQAITPPTPPISITVELDGAVVGGAIRDSSINDSLSGSFNTVNRTSRFAPQGVIPV
jgi:hypothetical protein